MHRKKKIKAFHIERWEFAHRNTDYEKWTTAKDFYEVQYENVRWLSLCIPGPCGKAAELPRLHQCSSLPSGQGFRLRMSAQPQLQRLSHVRLTHGDGQRRLSRLAPTLWQQQVSIPACAGL